MLDIKRIVKPLNEMRYPTVGDWYVYYDTLFIVAVETGNPLFNELLLLHETIEATIFLTSGGKEDVVTQWDLDHIDNADEPGDLPAAPYHDAHMLALIAERAAATILGVDWMEYEDTIDSIYEEQKHLPRSIWPLLQKSAAA